MYYEIFSMKSSQLAQYLNDWCQKIVHWRQVSMNLRWPSCMTRAKIIEIPNPFLYSRAARKKFSFQYAEADHQPPAASQQPCVLSEACLSFVLVHFLPFLFSCFFTHCCHFHKKFIKELGKRTKTRTSYFFCRQKAKSQKAERTQSQNSARTSVEGRLWLLWLRCCLMCPPENGG